MQKNKRNIIEDLLLTEFLELEHRVVNAEDSMVFDFRNNPIIFKDDWRLLMQVVKKIESLGFSFTIFEKSYVISPTNENNIKCRFDRAASFESKDDAVYYGCLAFVEAYNELKTETEIKNN
jgi:hypothetical protein